MNQNSSHKVTITSKTSTSLFPTGSADVLTHSTWDTDANTLVVHLRNAHASLSGEQGFRRIKLVCNTYMPKSLCDYLHFHGLSYDGYLQDLMKEIARDYQVSPKDVSALATGVDMNDLSQAFESYENLWVHAWVTAGFRHNAMRVGIDEANGSEVNGKYRPCGTINIIVTTNARLSLGTMASSFVTITEAKGVALQDLNIHSSFNPKLQATGTGTDQIIVVSGNDFVCRYAGGHTKLGELIAKAVTRACKTACQRQLAKDPSYHAASEIN